MSYMANAYLKGILDEVYFLNLCFLNSERASQRAEKEKENPPTGLESFFRGAGYWTSAAVEGGATTYCSLSALDGDLLPAAVYFGLKIATNGTSWCIKKVSGAYGCDDPIKEPYPGNP